MGPEVLRAAVPPAVERRPANLLHVESRPDGGRGRRRAQAWHTKVPSGDGPVLAVPGPGLVCAACDDGTLHALDAATGERRWAADFLADAPKDPPGFRGDVARVGTAKARPAALTTDGGAVFVSVYDQSRVVAFDAATGKRLWSFQAGGWVSGGAAATALRVLRRQPGRPLLLPGPDDGAQDLELQDGRPDQFGRGRGRGVCLLRVLRRPRLLPRPGPREGTMDVHRRPGARATARLPSPPSRSSGGDSVYFAAGEGQRCMGSRPSDGPAQGQGPAVRGVGDVLLAGGGRRDAVSA